MALAIREEAVDSIRVLVLEGRLDTDTSADLELAVQDLLQAGERQFVVDLSGVGYVSSAGLRVLLMLGKSVDAKGSLRLAALNASVRQVFDVAGFTQLFAIHPDRASALGATPRRAEATAASGASVPAKPEPAKPEPARTEAARTEPAKSELAARLLGANGKVAAGAAADAELVARSARLLGAERKS